MVHYFAGRIEITKEVVVGSCKETRIAKITYWYSKRFHLKARLLAEKGMPRPQEEAASVFSHTTLIGALIKDVLSLASFEMGTQTSCPAIY